MDAAAGLAPIRPAAVDGLVTMGLMAAGGRLPGTGGGGIRLPPTPGKDTGQRQMLL